MQRLLFLVLLVAAAPVSAQTNGEASEPETQPTIVIESVNSDPVPEPKEQLRSTEIRRKIDLFKSMEKSAANEKVVDDHAWVQETLRTSGPLVHGLQRYARSNDDVALRWRTAIRLQAAAHDAFRLRKFHTAVFLTLRARDAARDGYEVAYVTRAKTVEDTAKEKDYASQSNATQAQPFVDAATKALPDSQLDPGKSPHKWRTVPVVD